MQNAIEIYKSPDGSIQLDVKLENDTVWLTQSQMAELFGIDRTSVTRHIKNIYATQEFDESSTCAKNAQVRIEGRRRIVREIPFYNLDMVISVGYRINSKNATSFRRWATAILKQYLIKGYVINQQRLDNYNELKNVVKLMSRAITLQQKVTMGEYEGLFNVISDYVYALDTLDRYDYQSLDISRTTKKEPFHATYDNKRIAAMLFLWFLDKNGILYGEDGHKRIADNTLVALTLMIAESRTEEKDVMVKVVVNLINKENK